MTITSHPGAPPQGPRGQWGNWLRQIPAITGLTVLFAVLVLAGGFTAMAVFGGPSVNAGAITALATAVLGVVGTHVGHMAGSGQASGSPSSPKLEQEREQALEGSSQDRG
jgi:hypothetical protein